ncbi:MAG: aminotransferase class V-fold PLP-dependent enzyme [Phycisphaerales bacterium]|jgi:methionine-gamma-lyase|nr:aminotransferase class V-fold PLP-dependent enzyme [Phycisphaerales bacterium]
MTTPFDPQQAMADSRHEFGEHGGVNMSIEASTTFTVMTPDIMPEIFEGLHGPDDGGCYLYGRHFNPTVYVLGRMVAAMEGAEAGYCAASGLAAISSVIMQRCGGGGKVVSSNTLYGGTWALLAEYLPKNCGVETTFVDIQNLESVEEAMQHGASILYTESLSNPTLRVADIAALAEIAHKYNAILVVDNTFTPMMVSPMQLGADVVVHSATKFISGASDVIAGIICASQDFINELMDLHNGSLMLLGPTMDPLVAFRLSLRLPHLASRMKEHSTRAMLFSKRLQEMNLKITYPGLPSHPDHELFTTQLNQEYGYGGLFTLDMGTEEKAYALLNHLQNKEQFGYMAVSLGYFDTLMSCSGSSTSSELDERALKEAGISPGLVRFSIGLTGGIEQRWSQMEAAIAHANSV